MTNIIKFEINDMANRRFFREIQTRRDALSKRMDEKLKNENLTERQRQEAIMIKAVMDGDDETLYKAIAMIDRLDAAKMDTVVKDKA